MSLNSSSQATLKLGEMFVAHRGWLTGILRRKLGCAHRAEDFAQETFLKVLAMRAIASIQEPRAFLRTVSHGLMVSSWRRAELERSYLDKLRAHPLEHAPSAEDHALALERLSEVESMMSSFSAKARRAFILSQVEGRTYAEIAVELKVSERMVKKYMAESMQKLLTFDE